MGFLVLAGIVILIVMLITLHSTAECVRDFPGRQNPSAIFFVRGFRDLPVFHGNFDDRSAKTQFAFPALERPLWWCRWY